MGQHVEAVSRSRREGEYEGGNEGREGGGEARGRGRCGRGGAGKNGQSLEGWMRK